VHRVRHSVMMCEWLILAFHFLKILKHWKYFSWLIFSTVTETSVHPFYWKVPRLCHFVRRLTVAVNMMSIKNFWSDTDRGNPKYLGRPCPRASACTSHRTRTGLGSVKGRWITVEALNTIILFYMQYKDSVCFS